MPSDQDGFVMVPIKPEGAVELKLFEVEEVENGTVLMCERLGEGEDDKGVHVFEAVDSHSVLDFKQLDDLVVVNGPAQDIDGFVMVPIKPSGAVELHLFQIEEVVRGSQLRCFRLAQ